MKQHFHFHIGSEQISVLLLRWLLQHPTSQGWILNTSPYASTRGGLSLILAEASNLLLISQLLELRLMPCVIFQIALARSLGRHPPRHSPPASDCWRSISSTLLPSPASSSAASMNTSFCNTGDKDRLVLDVQLELANSSAADIAWGCPSCAFATHTSASNTARLECVDVREVLLAQPALPDDHFPSRWLRFPEATSVSKPQHSGGTPMVRRLVLHIPNSKTFPTIRLEDQMFLFCPP